ncbi:hypothetical protein GCM10009740_28080 [Terrabacter terrae]|uniref:ABC transporter domain-containing protein n=1 Tax=Terrabacter terrae TaxID=318434 RepID=A0ABN2UEH5_9MICO
MRSSATSAPNGAGKTRTLRPLVGLTRATSGSAELFELHAWRHRDELHRRVGYVPGDVSLYPRLTGQDHVDYLGHLHRLGRPPDAAALARQLDLDLGGPVDWLSPAQKLSPFYQSAAHDPLRSGVSWPAVEVAAGTVVVFALLGVVTFGGRDVSS